MLEPDNSKQTLLKHHNEFKPNYRTKLLKRLIEPIPLPRCDVFSHLKISQKSSKDAAS
jgi:hypothetical protein